MSKRLEAIVLLVGLPLVYGLAFLPLFAVMEGVVGAVGFVLIAVGGGRLGVRLGLLLAVLIGAVNSVMYALVMPSDLTVDVSAFVLGLAIGAGSGRLGRLAGQLRRQAGQLSVANRELHLAQTMLQERHQDNAALLNGLPAAAYLKDAQLRYVAVNEMFCRSLDLPAERIIGRQDHDLYPAARAREYREAEEAALAGGTLVVREETVARDAAAGATASAENGPEDAVTVLSTRLSPLLDAEGGREGLIGIKFDISAQKRTENSLREAKQSAEEATLAKEKFLSLIAHDLRAPVSVVLGYLSMMQDRTEPPSPGSQAEYLQAVSARMKGMSNLIERVLSMNQIRSGNLLVEKHFVNAPLLAANAMGLCPQAEAKGITVINELPPEALLYADLTLVGEVVLNVFSNAIKFTNPGGSIRLYMPDDRPGTIALSDSGVGMSPDVVRDLFKHDVKTSSPGTAGETGTGMGLPLSMDIMTAHGGSLTCESSPGVGSTFSIGLPPHPPTVLVVDKDPAFRAMQKYQLERIGARVLEATDEAEAMPLLAVEPINLVVADLAMLGAEGLEFISHLRAHLRRAVPILLITHDRAALTLDDAFNAGADDFLTTPFHMQDYLPRVRRLLLSGN